jgi:hypothetical protein
MKLRDWISRFESQFEPEQLDATIIGADVKVALYNEEDVKAEFHKLEYRNRDGVQVTN